MSGYKEIESGALHNLMDQGKVTLVDVRTDEEASRGIIHGALHIPLHLLPLKLDELAGGEPLVFYCHSGVRSAQASAFAAGKGRSNIFNLRGGILAWGAAGYALEPKTRSN